MSFFRAALMAAASIVSISQAQAADSLGVSGFTPVYFNMSSGDYSATGSSVYYGGTFLEGSGYVISGGIVNASETVPLTLKDAHAYPNPCSIRKGCSSVIFTKITISAELKIYTVSGELVWSRKKNNSDPTITWNLKNEQGSEAASGLYVYYVKTGNSSKKGKLILIR